MSVTVGTAWMIIRVCFLRVFGVSIAACLPSGTTSVSFRMGTPDEGGAILSGFKNGRDEAQNERPVVTYLPTKHLCS